jgi:hypothetical protein
MNLYIIINGLTEYMIRAIFFFASSVKNLLKITFDTEGSFDLIFEFDLSYVPKVICIPNLVTF